MGDILGLALRPIVSCSAQASRPLASLANSSLQKSSVDRIQLPIILDFRSDEGKQDIRKWYYEQPTTWFTRVEHRKDTTGPFQHEFIVVYLENSTVCRFDRRARDDMRGYALKDEGTISEDSAHVITLADTKSRAQLDQSEVLFGFKLDWKQNLEFILAVCCGIQSHPKAKSYSLLHYNCYFFSWTLVMTIKRKGLVHWNLATAKKRVWKKVSEVLIERIREQQAIPSKTKGFALGNRFIRVGWSIVGVDSRQASLLPPVESFICGGMEESLANYNLKLINEFLPKEELFWSWSPSMLEEEVLAALRRGAQQGVKRFTTANAPSLRKGKLPAPIYSGSEGLRGKDVSNGGYVTPAEERARQKAQKVSEEIYKRFASTQVPHILKGGVTSNLLLALGGRPCFVHVSDVFVHS
ncbi:hypothetical protein RSOLAG22IIIB_07301 [Rhizoctonia solani]|uniref:Uncharacterized protein n=1 Tax=Rhizoctonia solani TaxID=456999 RepID=A0A0K6FLW6_9AGAM|nr:hypothetical protein RSOLAG22IIIB_07301 [Rhizoctonia solani]